MDKGLFVIVAIGIVIVYFATNFSDDKPIDGDVSWSVHEKTHSYDKYYKKDAIGDRVLDFSSVSLDHAKKIWPTTPAGKQIASSLPDFSLAKIEADNNIIQGDFRRYLMKYLEKLERRYLAGEIDGDRAQKALLEFQ